MRLNKTYQIRFTGAVQGVGFRPFVFRKAKEHNISGFVTNDGKGVKIVAQGAEPDVGAFFHALQTLPPPQANILQADIEETNIAENYTGFAILHSAQNSAVNIPLTPDFAICAQCENEMMNPENRRYLYPLISCTECGMRYAVTQKFPFDRAATSLHNFAMCANCQTEYTHPDNRRFHSQTNTCKECIPPFELYVKDTRVISKNTRIFSEGDETFFGEIVQYLKEGKIIAVKNTSGYLLLCDATNPDAIATLRTRKNRPRKPFAVLFPSIEDMEDELYVSPEAVRAFQSPAAPIVILKVRPQTTLPLWQIAPEMNTVGAMRPYSGMLNVIASLFHKPLIATSANVHGSPICADKETAENHLAEIADAFLHHGIPIVHPQDDSVVRFTASQKRIILRRSRGFAPNIMFSDVLEKENPQHKKILCLGADLKSAITLAPNRHTYVSEYMGNLGNYDNYLRYEKTVQQYTALFQCSPNVIVYDRHPHYENRKVLELFPNKNRVERVHVQHHKAHFAAILGEHRLWRCGQPVLGFIWDGVGFGDDDAIWGSECFLWNGQTMNRVASLAPYAWLMGDAMSENPALSAFSISGGNQLLEKYFAPNQWRVYNKQLKKSILQTTSMGRLFDAVAFVLGFRNTISFEGEAAMWLEKIATEASQHLQQPMLDYLDGKKTDNRIPTRILLEKIMDALKNNVSPDIVALNFHYTLAKAIEKTALSHSVSHLAFSGGVFQNALLIDLLQDCLSLQYKLYFHENLSSGDENISFGQLNYYLHISQKQLNTVNNLTDEVSF